MITPTMKLTLTLLTALLLAPLAALHPADSAAAVPVGSIPAASWQVVQRPGAAVAGTCVAKGNTVELTWQESVAVTCEIKPLVNKRLYTLEGRAFATRGEVKLAVVIKQFPGSYPVAEPPDTVTELTVKASQDGSPFAIPFALRTPNSRLTIAIEASGPAKAVSLADVVVRGEGDYVASFKDSEPEKVEIQEARIREALAGRNWEQAEVVAENGTVRLQVAGESLPKFAYNSGIFKEGAGHHGLFADKGVHLHAINAVSPDFFHNPIWKARGEYDFDLIERAIKRVLAVDPEAKIIFGVWADVYPEWGRENPDEVCANTAGLKAIGDAHFGQWGTDPGTKRFLPSVFSTKAQREVGEMLAKIDEWTDTHEVGKAVVGYFLWGFNDADFGHWVHPATSSKEKDLDDYSPAAQRAFRVWLKKKYRDDPKALSRAWGQSGMSFETVTIPTPERRRVKAGDLFPWLGPAEQDVRDFNQFYGEAPGALLDGITAELRARMKRKKLVMSHFGNVMHGWRGYVGLGKMIDAPGINCLAATSDYGMRFPGYPGGFDSMPDSIRLHGKLFFHEFDYRSFTSRKKDDESYNFGVGRAKDAVAHQAMFLREAGNLAAHGQGIYCLDHEGPSYADAGIMNGVARGYQTYRSLADLRAAPEADVALFINEHSVNSLCEDLESSRFLMRLTRRHRPQWDTSGVPYHLYLQRDLIHPRLPKYKVYAFLMPQEMSPAEIAAVNALKRDGNTLIFLHAPGMLNGPDAAKSIAAITGMEVVRLTGSQALAGVWLPSENPLVKNLTNRFGDRPIAWSFTDRESRGLAFAVTDKAAVPLAKYRDSADIACAVKEFPEWRCVFMGVPWLEAQFIANLADTAGAWRAGEPHDAVFASQHLITIHALSGGKKTLRPRNPSKITDATTGEVIAEKSGEFSIDIPFGQTRVFRTEALPNPR
jgi:hypothetical protein